MRSTAQTEAAGHADEVLQPLRKLPGAYGTPRALATFHFLYGEIDRAADRAMQSLKQRDPGIAQLLVFAPFRSGANWPAVAEIMHLPDQNLPAG